MDNYNKDGEGRRDYGQNTERRYSSEGRVLRPRRTSNGGHEAHGENRGGRKPYGEHRPSYGEHKPYGEHRSSYGDRRQNFSDNGERRSYGENKPYGERRSYGDRKPYGERRSDFSGNGEQRGYGENKPYGERRPYGDRKPYGGERRQNFSDNGERRSYGENRPYGERRSYGENRPYGEHWPHSDRKPYGERRPYGDRKPYGARGGYQQRGRAPYKREESFNENDEAGIQRMLSTKPQVDRMAYSDNDSVKTMIKDEIRLNKFIANSGVCSRREADTLIQAGVVTVNGEVVTELGTKVNIHNDDIRFNGERLKGEEKVYVVMNKPKGFVTTASDPHAEKTVMDLLKGCQSRIFPVGRLDKATTGVLMFTNDGEIAERLTHPSYDKKKIYQVILDHDLAQEDYDRILDCITLSDGDVKADDLQYIDENDHRKLGIEIHSGKNRIVRRIFESLGYDVRALDRVYFAGLTKKGLQKGEWRYLTEGEVNILKMGAYV